MLYQIVVKFNDGAKVRGTWFGDRKKCEQAISDYRALQPNSEKEYGFEICIEEIE